MMTKSIFLVELCLKGNQKILYVYGISDVKWKAVMFMRIQYPVFFPQQVMKDKWMNTGYEGEDLKPHIEPVEDYSDASRIGEHLF